MGIEQALKRAEVFLGLDDSDLGKIAALPSCREESFPTGHVIFRAGEEAKYLYILEEGKVDLAMAVPSVPEKEAIKVVIDRVTTGGFFGWSALVKPHFYTMSAICVETVRVVIISGIELMALFESDYRVGYKVLQCLSHVIGTRLRDMEQVVVRGQRWPFFKR